MSSHAEGPPLVWQGAADRTPARYIAIRVTGVEKEGGGLFGLRNAPSLAGALPDSHVLKGAVISGGGPANVTARIPGGELPAGLGKGDRAVLGLVDDAHVISILRPPASVPDAELPAWAAARPAG